MLLPQEWPIFTFPDEKHDNPVRKLLLVSSLPDICPESVCLSWQIIIVFHRGEAEGELKHRPLSFQLEFYGIYPGEQIGQTSAPALLAAARNTVLLADVTDPLQENAFQEIFPSFVRVRQPLFRATLY